MYHRGPVGRRAAAVATALALAAGVNLTACDDGDRVAPEALSPPAAPSALVGLWRVAGQGIASGSYLRFDADGRMFLFQKCGSPFGQWRALPSGAFVAMLVVAAPDCPKIPGPDEWERNTPVWLRSVIAARRRLDEQVLVDEQGRILARLARAQEAPGRDLPGERVAPAVPTEAQRRALDAGSGPGAPRSVDLVGRWVPENGPPAAFVRFDPDGALAMHDGCNAGRGRWTVDGSGGLAVVLSLSYVIACENAPLAGWLQKATTVDRTETALRLSGPDGAAIGMLRMA